MDGIEIRQNKKTLIPMLLLLTIALVGSTYSYFSGKPHSNNIFQLIHLIFIALLAYAIFISTRKFLKNEAVLILSADGIMINDKIKPVSFSWFQITEWTIEKDSDGPTRYLIIKTSGTKKKINISWLEKKPEEIGRLISEFKK